MRVYTLRREQWLPVSLDRVFEFFSDAANLERITPDWLRFRILVMPAHMTEGARIKYRLEWHGIPMNWLTEVVEWNPPRGFADLQLEGPYALWLHTHRFERSGAGTNIVDLVRYALPLGVLGQAAHDIRVRRDIEQIFDFRQTRIVSLLAPGGQGRG
jgi:ligand-binding SRPBCC domain-containing protein